MLWLGRVYEYDLEDDKRARVSVSSGRSNVSHCYVLNCILLCPFLTFTLSPSEGVFMSVITKSTNASLTEGSILRVLTSLSLPIVAAAFLSTLYSVVDMAWIGLMGGEVLAGVGTGSMYVWLSQGHVALSKMGGQILMAQELGAGNKETAAKYAWETIHLTILSGILYGILSVIFVEPMIAFYKLGSPVAIDAARTYIYIVCGLIIFSYMGQTLTGLYTAQGDSKTPLKANIAGLVINLVLDPVLIFGLGPFPELRTAGAAIATVAAQFVTMVILLVGIWKNHSEGNVLRQMKPTWRADKKFRNRIMKMGWPNAVQGLVYCGISMILSRMVSVFGDIIIAVFRVGGQVEAISWNVANGFGAAMNAFAAQNYGAGKMERVNKGYRLSAITVVAWGLATTALFIVFPEQISGLFFHTEMEIQESVYYLVIVGLGQAFMCLELMSVGAISGLGNTAVCSVISIVFTAIRIPMAMVLCATNLGANGLWWALTISTTLKGVLFYGAFKRESKKKAVA